MNYPTPKKIDHITKKFNDEINDHYFWMRNQKEDSDVLELLNKENEITKSYLNDVKDLKEKIFEELKSRELETYETCPYKHGDYLYYERYEAGKEYPIHCRKKIGSDKEEICLDENEMAKGLDYFSLGVFDLSHDHKILAYSVDTDGSELYTLKFKNLETGEIYSDEIKNTARSVCWFNNSYDIVYVIQNENQRPYKVLSHKLGEKIESDRVLFEEKSGEFFVSVSETMDHDYILITSSGSITSETLYLDGANPSSDVKLFQERTHGLEYYVEHKDGEFYVVTNDTHKNFRVCTTTIDATTKENWKEFIAPSDQKYINDFSCYKDFFINNYKEGGLNKLELIYNDGKKELISFPEDAYYIEDGDNAEFDTKTYRYNYYSLTKPLSSFDYDISTKQSTKVYTKEVPGYDEELYKVERIEYPSHDGTLIPMSILYKKDLNLDGKAPCYLYGYGSYGACIEPWFNKRIFSLVDRGFVYAIAHIRGSATLGRQWYEDGKFLKKKNTFEDFNAAAEFLANNNYSSEGNIVISGGSAGGLLVGATMNIAKPGLLKAVIADVPFVDVLNTMLDSSLPLTELEYDEWGNPNVEEYYHYIKSYSPYDNIEEKNYPAVLAIAGLNDPRVTYWEPMKWTYKLRDFAKDSNPKLLHTNMEAGHAGASGRFEFLKEDAMVYSFVLKQFGIKA
jgi:oligopeptidase B